MFAFVAMLRFQKLAALSALFGLLNAAGPEAVRIKRSALKRERTFRGKVYQIISDHKLQFTEAQRACHDVGGDLLTVKDSATQNFLNQWTKGLGKSQIWLGLRRTGPHRGDFMWTDGQPLNYTNWSPGEPNDQDPSTWGGEIEGEEHWMEGCVEMYVNDPDEPHGSWNDVPCSYDPKTIICQGVDSTDTSEPKRDVYLIPVIVLTLLFLLIAAVIVAAVIFCRRRLLLASAGSSVAYAGLQSELLNPAD